MIDLKKDAGKICLRCECPIREHTLPTATWDIGYPDIAPTFWVCCPKDGHPMNLKKIKVRNATILECLEAFFKELKNLWCIIKRKLFKQ